MFPRLLKPPSVSAEGMLQAQLPAVPTASLTASDRPLGGKTCRVLGQDRDADMMLVWHLGILSRGTCVWQRYHTGVHTEPGTSLPPHSSCFSHPLLPPASPPCLCPLSKWEAVLRVAPPGGWWQRAGTACPAQDRAQGARGEHFHHLCGAQPPGADFPDGSGLPSPLPGQPRASGRALRPRSGSSRKPPENPHPRTSPRPRRARGQPQRPAARCRSTSRVAEAETSLRAEAGWRGAGCGHPGGSPRSDPAAPGARSRPGSGTHLAARGTAAGCSRRRARTPSRSHSGGAPGGSRCGGGGGCAPSTRSPRSPPPARPSRARCWRRGPRGGRNRHRHRHLTERPRPGGAGPRGGQGARPAPAPAPAPASGGPASPPGPAAATRWTGPARPRRRDRGC